MTYRLLSKNKPLYLRYNRHTAPIGYISPGSTAGARLLNRELLAIKEILSLIAFRKADIPEETTGLVYYSDALRRYLNVDIEEFVKSFIERKRSKFKYDHSSPKEYMQPEQEDLLGYFIRALHSHKTLLEAKIRVAAAIALEITAVH